MRERYSGGQHPPRCWPSSAAPPRPGRRARARRPPAARAHPRGDDPDAERADQGARAADRTAVREHPDGQIFLSLFKSPASVITAAELLAEIGDCRERYPTRDALAADAGQAAVAIESGKRKTAGFRWACNKRLRDAFCRAGRQHPPLAPLGADPLRRSPPARPRPPPRDPHPRPRLVPHRLALLAGPHPVRPRPPPRPATPHHRHHPHPVGPRARPRRHPADGRRRRHPTGGPQGRARSA